jgi:thiol-disulfide isomerase/thioredoxin
VTPTAPERRSPLAPSPEQLEELRELLEGVNFTAGKELVLRGRTLEVVMAFWELEDLSTLPRRVSAGPTECPSGAVSVPGKALDGSLADPEKAVAELASLTPEAATPELLAALAPLLFSANWRVAAAAAEAVDRLGQGEAIEPHLHEPDQQESTQGGFAPRGDLEGVISAFTRDALRLRLDGVGSWVCGQDAFGTVLRIAQPGDRGALVLRGLSAGMTYEAHVPGAVRPTWREYKSADGRVRGVVRQERSQRTVVAFETREPSLAEATVCFSLVPASGGIGHTGEVRLRESDDGLWKGEWAGQVSLSDSCGLIFDVLEVGKHLQPTTGKLPTRSGDRVHPSLDPPGSRWDRIEGPQWELEPSQPIQELPQPTSEQDPAPLERQPSPSTVQFELEERRADTPVLEGPTVPGYQLLSRLGRGGMGIVWKARDLALGRVVALKMIRDIDFASEEERWRFRQEAPTVARLMHPHIVQIFHVGEHQGTPFYAMEFCANGSLAERLSGGPLTAREAAALVEKVARAVHAAHLAQVVHRDLKPANVLLSASGEPKVTDFGLAKRLGEQGQTRSGAVLGTPEYMPPEQARGRKEIGPWVDVYALGAILYECLTGRPPFKAATPFDTVVQVISEEPVPVRRLQPRTPGDLETICHKCLEKDRSRRYASALALAEDLRRFQAGAPVLARPAGAVVRAAKWGRRHPGLAALAVAILLVFTLGSAMLSYFGLAANAEAKTAALKAAEAELHSSAVETSFKERVSQVDDYMIRLDNRLANMAGAEHVRLEFLNDAIRFNESLLQEHPNDPRLRRQTAHCYLRLGDLWGKRPDVKEGIAAYAKAMELQNRLMEEFPKQPHYRRDLAETWSHRARLLGAVKNYREAFQAYEQAIQLQDKSITDGPASVDDRLQATQYRFERANLLEESNQRSTAEKAYRETLGMQEQLAAENPSHGPCDAAIATTAFSLAMLVEDRKPKEAWAFLQQEMKAWREARRLAPHMGSSDTGLRESYNAAAEFCKRQRRYTDLATLAANLRTDFPESHIDTYNAACFLAHAVEAVQNHPALPDAERARLADPYSGEAVALLNRSFQEGNTDLAHMERDTDLDPLREHKAYQQLLAERESHAPDSLTPAKRVRELASAYQNAVASYQAALQQAQTVAQRKLVTHNQPNLSRFVEQFLRLADRNRETTTGIDALTWVLQATDPDRKPSTSTAPLRVRALSLLQRDHLSNPELGSLCTMLAADPMPDTAPFLRTVFSKHTSKEVRGLAGYALAITKDYEASQAGPMERTRAEECRREAEALLEQIQEQYAAVSYGAATLGEAARAKLLQLQHLTIGREAQDITGDDMDGKALKLSAYRGKVVVLDFWANWCGWCRQMYPQERQLVQRMEGRPFVLLGVNCDDDKDEARMAIARQALTWRSWWDGGKTGGRIRRQWQVVSFPTIYVLDQKGVIRYKGLRGQQLEAAVEQLVQACEGETKGQRSP